MSWVVSKYPNAPFSFLTNKALEAQTLGYMVYVWGGGIHANVYLVIINCIKAFSLCLSSL